MKIKLFCFYLFSLVLTTTLHAQSISGTILDSLQQPVPFVAAGLLNAKDSTLIKGTNTNENGVFNFDNIKSGNYLVMVEAAGYRKTFSKVYGVDSTGTVKTDPLVLQSQAVNLNEVAVVFVKKLVEFKNGNITVNIENSPLAIGNSLYDLLSRLPTVMVTDDNISIQGKQGVRVLIDERLQQQTGQQLINLLKSIQAGSIEKIEILKNPPVKYDAAGAAFISVKTKKLKITGFSGSVSSNYSQGYYANKGIGISLNYKGRDFAVFSSLNGGNDEQLYTSLFNRNVTYDGVTTNFNQVTREKASSLYASYNIGADWYLNKRNTIGFRIDGTQGTSTPDRKGYNDLSDNSLGYTRLEFGSIRPNSWNYINYNLNAEHKFDTLNTVLRFSFDYSPNLDLNKGDFQNYFVDSAGNNKLAPKIFKSDNNLQFIIYSSKFDFEEQLSKTLKMEAGAKGNDQSMITNYNFSNRDEATGAYLLDSAFTNGFTYKEQVVAAYLNLLKEYKKMSFQAGVRGENTSIKASSKTNNITYTRDYFNLFPMLSVNYNPSEKHSWQFSYNRRINRPDYTSFNPYKYFVNLFVSFRGNPYMLPEYHHNIEFTHGYKNSFYNTLSFSVINNIFYGYPIQNDSTKESEQTQSNLKECFNYSYSTFVQKELFKWWNLSLNGVASYLTFNGAIDGRPYSGVSFQYYGYLNNQFTLPKGFKIEASFEYQAPGNVVIYRNKNSWSLNVAIRKSFLNNKLNATIGMNDVFYTSVRRNSADYVNIHSNLKTTFDTQRFKANLSYSFGKVKVQQRQTKSNQEEKGRLNH